MTFFYDLNKRLADLATKQDAQQISEDAKATAPKSKLTESIEVAERATGDYSAKKGAAGKDLGKPGKNFAKIAKSSGGGEKGNRIAGAQLAKMRAKGQVEEGYNPVKAVKQCAKDYMEMNGIRSVHDLEAEDIESIGSDCQMGYQDVCEILGCNLPDSLGPVKSYDEHGDMEEGNAFTGKLANAKMDHKSEFEVDGKKYKVVEAECSGCNCSPCKCNEGNAFTGALKATSKGSKFKLGNKEFTDTSDIEEGFADMDAWLASREKEKGTGKFDKKERTLPSGMKATTYTRRHEDDVEDDSDAPASKGGAPKKRGRPMGKPKGPERITKGAWKHKTGRVANEQETDEGWRGGMHGEPSVVKTGKKDPNAKVEAWNGLMAIVARGQGMEPAVLKHLKQIARTLKPEELELDEEKVEAGKREFFDRIAPAAKQASKLIKSLSKGKREVDEESTDKEDTKAERAGKKVAKDIEYDKGDKAKDDNKAEKAGKKVTKDIEYDDKKDRKEKKTESSKPDFLDADKDGDKKEPMKKAFKDKKEEKVDETTVAGSVATSTSNGKSSGGMQFGKGVYEGFNNSVEKMITESISVESTMSESECGEGEMSPGITITADGEEAAKLMMLLKLAGLDSQVPATCPSCGNTPCGCAEVVDENSPDWPTNTEKSNNAFQYSGGLNGPKSTGQTTVPVVASQLRRQISMEESVELERSLFKTWKNYKG